jgi:hypothetical protein
MKYLIRTAQFLFALGTIFLLTIYCPYELGGLFVRLMNWQPSWNVVILNMFSEWGIGIFALTGTLIIGLLIWGLIKMAFFFICNYGSVLLWLEFVFPMVYHSDKPKGDELC